MVTRTESTQGQRRGMGWVAGILRMENGICTGTGDTKVLSLLSFISHLPLLTTYPPYQKQNTPPKPKKSLSLSRRKQSQWDFFSTWPWNVCHFAIWAGIGHVRNYQPQDENQPKSFFHSSSNILWVPPGSQGAILSLASCSIQLGWCHWTTH